jgi:hypothetical protein
MYSFINVDIRANLDHLVTNFVSIQLHRQMPGTPSSSTQSCDSRITTYNSYCQKHPENKLCKQSIPDIPHFNVILD